MKPKQKKPIDLVVPLFAARDIKQKEALQILKEFGTGKSIVTLNKLRKREKQRPEALQTKRLNRARLWYDEYQEKQNKIPVVQSDKSEKMPEISEDPILAEFTVESLAKLGIYNAQSAIATLQSQTALVLPEEIKILDRIRQKLSAKLKVNSKSLKISELKAATSIMRELIKLRRDAALLPFGAVETSKALKPAATHQHVHLPNVGMSDATPKKIG